MIPPANNTREAVVILHGVAINTRFTARLARLIAAAGYEVHNLDYPSRSVALADLGPHWLASKLGELGLERAPRLHFVTHSMGGLIVRGLLAAHRPANLGRVVTIAPPHQGSAISDRLRQLPIIWSIIGRNLGALGTGPDAYWRTLPQRADFELGVIAGSFAINPLGWFFLEGTSDGTVAETSTRLAGMADHITLHSNHTLILFRRRTALQAIAFLRTGRFSR
jgi:triacylglycerol esterase/lipase EstA (alpha/beta hydrolase family)